MAYRLGTILTKIVQHKTSVTSLPSHTHIHTKNVVLNRWTEYLNTKIDSQEYN